MILNPNKTKALVVSKSRTVSLPMGNKLVMSDVSILASPNLYIILINMTASSPLRSCALCLVSLRELVFWGWWASHGGHLCISSLLLCIYSPNLWVFLSGVGVRCWMPPLASGEPGVFGGQSFPWSEFLAHVFVSSTSCCWTVYVVLGSFELEAPFVQWASFYFYQSSRSRAAAAAHPLKFKVSMCRTSQFEKCFLPA